MAKWQEIQSAFTSRVRDPQTFPCPTSVSPSRMEVYEELVFNNLEDILSSNFPVLKSILTEEYWENLVKLFLIKHRAETPFFYELSQEFIQFLKHEKIKGPPFLLALAEYEWMELVVELADEEIDKNQINFQGDLLHEPIVLSPFIRLLQYNFSVHRISVDFIPLFPDEQPTFLLVYRDHHNVVGFVVLNNIAARLLAILINVEGMTGNAAIKQIIDELQHPNPEVVQDGGQTLLTQWREAGIILGVRKGG